MSSRSSRTYSSSTRCSLTESLKLRVSDPTLLLNMLPLHETNISQVQININRYLQQQTGSTVVFLASLLTAPSEVVVHVVGTQVQDPELRYPVSEHVADPHAQSRSTVASEAATLRATLRELVSPPPTQFLAVPVPHPIEERFVALVCLSDYASRDNADVYYTNVVLDCFHITLGVFVNSLLHEEEKRLRKHHQALLEAVNTLFEQLSGTVPDVLKAIVTAARKLTNAERCLIYMVDHEKDELIGNLVDADASKAEARFPVETGIAGRVFMTERIAKVDDAQKDSFFCKEVDEASTVFKTRNALCFPIRDQLRVISVAELCNKINKPHFVAADEAMVMEFSRFCGVVLTHVSIGQRDNELLSRYDTVRDLLRPPTEIPSDELKTVLTCTKNHVKIRFTTFEFSPGEILLSETPCYLLRMFKDLDLPQKFHIPDDTLVRFIVTVRAGYREAPYHNWWHAFSTTHFAYLLVTNLKLLHHDYMTPLECLAFMVASLCHDLDHCGTIAQSHLAPNATLASLYSSEGAVSERHHLTQTVCILANEGCNILDGLTPEEYSDCLALVSDMILDTNLTAHLEVFAEQQAVVTSGYQRHNQRHKRLFFAMCMTACDLSDHTRDWKLLRGIADHINQEFTACGELQQAMGAELCESEHEKAHDAELHVQFLSEVVIPLFRVLSSMFPAATCLLDGAKVNRTNWIQIIEKRAREEEQAKVAWDTQSMVLEDKVAAALKTWNT